MRLIPAGSHARTRKTSFSPATTWISLETFPLMLTDIEVTSLIGVK
jgi:hypothetical protein